jgi:hypothetical protein
VQGDAWRGLIAIDFCSGQRQPVAGLVISNSCDIAAANKPDAEQNVLFAPLMNLSEYERVLRERGKDNGYVSQQLDQIRKQEINRVFYLPPNGSLGAESMVLLDDIHAQPLAALGTGAKLERLFSLSNYGWYVLPLDSLYSHDGRCEASDLRCRRIESSGAVRSSAC